VHSSWAIVVAVSGPAASPVIVHRDRVALLEDDAMVEPYHAAAAAGLAEAPALIDSVAEAAATSAADIVRGFAESLGPVAAVGVVGGDRRLPDDLAKRVASHAMLHACERQLFEEAVIEGAARAGLPVATIPATGRLLADASDTLGVALEPTLTALGKTVGKPWQKDHKEATAVALLALSTS